MAAAEMAISPKPLREPSDSRADWERVIDELLKIRNLQDDWDGEGSAAPLPGLVDFAIALARSDRNRGAPAPDRIHAGVNATVYLEWHSPAGYCELEILSPVEAESRSASYESRFRCSHHCTSVSSVAATPGFSDTWSFQK